MTKVQGDVSTIAKNASAYLGGGANILSGAAPTYKVQSQSYNDVGSAFVGVDGSITDIYSKIASVAGGSLVEQEQEENGNGRIIIGSKVGGTAVDLTNKDGEGRTLSGLKDGTLSASSTEAVTGKQLYEVDTKLTETTQNVTDLSTSMDKAQGDISTVAKNTSAYLGGGSDVLGGIAPTYKVQGNDYSNVGSAFSGVDDSLSDIYKELSGSGGKSLVQQEKSEDGNGRITIGATVGGTEINLSNKDGEGRTLSGLKDGELSKSSTEAVTGKQLYEVDTKLTETTQNVTKIQADVTTIQGNVSTIAQNTSAYLGGGADILNGQKPTYKVQGTKHHDVGAAFAGVDTTLTKIRQEMNTNTESAAQNSLLWSDSEQAFVAHHGEKGQEKTNSKLKFLLGGDISEGSTEAITGGQLYKTNTKLAEYLGGAAGYEDGQWIDPTFTINILQEDGSTGEKEYKNVADALKDIGSSFTAVLETNLIQQEKSEDESGRITIGAKTRGKEVNLSNKDGENRTLSGLKDGTLSASSTEAVTGKQLYAVDTKLTETTDKVTKVQGDVSTVAKNTSAYLGGGADILTGQEPTYTVQGNDYKNVGAAFAGVDTTLTEIQQEMNASTESAAQNSLLWSDSEQAFVAHHGEKGQEKTNSKLKFLLGGDISEGSTEAITGGQLYEINKKLAAYLGGGADILTGQEPTYTIRGHNYKDVGSAFSGVDDSLSDIYKELSGSGSKSLVQQEEGENGRITIGAKTGGTEISLLNNQSVARVLSGLSDGAVSEGSNQAVTGNQLYKTNTKLAEYLGGGASYADGKWEDPTFTINVLQEDGSTGKKEYKNVADALKDVSSSLTTVVETNLIQQEKSEDESGRITIGANTGGTEVNLTNKDGENRTLSGLKDGTLSASSTEAVTGKQLYETNTELAKYLGGGAGYNNGVWTAPAFEIIQFNFGGKADGPKYEKYTNVADAFGGVNKSLENLNNRLGGVENQTENDVIKWNDEKKAYDASHKNEKGEMDAAKITNVADGEIDKNSKDAVNGGQLWDTNQRVGKLENKFDKFEETANQMAEGAVQYDKDKDGKKTNKVTLTGGDASAPVVIDNVGDGKVEKGSKEAINGGQLYEQMAVVLDDSKKYTDEKIQEAKDYTDMKFESLNYNIEGVKKEARQAAAIGLAVSNLRYEDAPGALSVAFSSGSWHSQSAIAFGAGYTSESGDIRSNFSVTTAGGHWGIGAGISVRLK
nr:hypothetical protein B11C_150103 [Bartonella sp. 1-1C]